MATVMQTIQRLLPVGTVRDDAESPCQVDWRTAPQWPPDLFAVAATLVNLSGAYAHASVTGATAGDASEVALHSQRLGEIWRTANPSGLADLTDQIQRLWNVLLGAANEPAACRMSATLPDWCRAALELLAIADEASSDIGFGKSSKLSAKTARRHLAPKPDETDESKRRRLTATLCELVPAEECCVQPKARTPQVGCTLRSLSHHLALLPPIGEVTTRYLMHPSPKEEDERELNLLLVPYPFAIRDDALLAHAEHPDEQWGLFRVQPTWLPHGTVQERAEQVAHFLVELVAEAAKGDRKPHGLVLPELALDAQVAQIVAESLAVRTDLELLVTGAVIPASAGAPPRNCVLNYLFSEHRCVSYWTQSKHHRWRLDDSQIARYRLGLKPGLFWWEDIDVTNREVAVYSFRGSATVATLICEDLARIDPVQPVLRAVGPNLLIALLMDGAQRRSRWSATYATALADDPGTSVLTLTSLGMIMRDVRTEKDAKVVGFWRDARGEARELRLDDGSHGLLLGLDLSFVEERTMDRRADGGVTADLKFRDAVPIRHPAPPAWLG